MAFTVEDGTGLDAANAYLAIQDWKDHHEDRGRDYATDGTYTDDEIQGAIVQASDYVDKRFGRRYRGCKMTYSQGLEWPRTDAYTDEEWSFQGVPRPLEKAIAEYAAIVLQLQRDLAPIPDPGFGVIDPETGEVTDAAAGPKTRKTEKVGPLEDTTEWGDGAASNKPMVSTGNALTQQIPAYPQADLWIEEIIEPSTDREVLRG
ncbi:MAG: hypothetical protein GY906_12145 [bacterium]|nr:hypothetical protein [bacterium]